MSDDPMLPDYLIDYLESATIPELEQLELLRLGRGSDIAKHLTASIKELVKAEAEAIVIRVMIDRKRAAKAKQPPPSAKDLLADVIPPQSTAAVIEEKLRRLEHTNGGRNGKKA